MNKEAGVLLDDWFWRNDAVWRSEGADPMEVREDVETHLVILFLIQFRVGLNWFCFLGLVF